MSENARNAGVERAVAHFAIENRNGISNLAGELGVTIPAVMQWLNGKRPVPVSRCIQIERSTGGVVRCDDLRDDIDWAFLRGTRQRRIKAAA